MADPGYPFKRHRGANQPRQRKSSSVQPQTTPPSRQAWNPNLPVPEDPQIINLPQTFPQFQSQPYGSHATGPMEWQQDGSQATDPTNWQQVGSQLSEQKFGSPAMSYTSYVHVNTPSGELPGSYPMVSSKSLSAYSNASGSNQTSEESGEQVSYSPPWEPAAECNMPREDLQSFQLPLNHQDHALMHLGGENLQPVYDPYQRRSTAATSGSEYHEYDNYTYQQAPEVSPAPKVQPVSTPPWNQIERRVPRFESSIAAFELSPGPAGTSEALSQYLAPPSGKSLPSTRQPKGHSRSRVGTAKKRDSSEGLSPGWEHITVQKGGLVFVSEHVDGNRHLSGGRRKGKLPDETKVKAARVRSVKACWRCWVAKAPCSEGDVCERCLKHCSGKAFNSATANQLCSRSGFIDFEPTLFPQFLHGHLTEESINALLIAHSDGYSDGTFRVQVTTGSVFKPMDLWVHFLRPKGGFENFDNGLVKQYSLTPVLEEGQSSGMVANYSAPVALMELYTPGLKRDLKKHIKEMLANPNYAAQTTMEDLSGLSHQILDFAIKYQKSAKSDLLRDALMLHAIHFYMGMLTTFTPSSATVVYAGCNNYSVLQPYLSSRVLNRQLKYAMHLYHRELTRSVLNDLEKTLRSRTKDVWGSAFAAILVLGMCIENLQAAADLYVVCDVKKEGDASEVRRSMSEEACKLVEELMWSKCTRLFYEIYRSGTPSNTGRERGFNPLKAMREGTEAGLELDRATKELVRNVWSLMRGNYEALLILSRRPITVPGEHESKIDPNSIKVNATGRLTAKFLTMFFGTEPMTM